MLVLLLPRVSSPVSGFPVASPCLWGKLQNISFSVSNSENWRKCRTKCSFWCSHVSRLESLVFLWPRRVYGESCKTSHFWRFPSRLSCRFAWQAWHFVTFRNLFYTVPKVSKLKEVSHEMFVLMLPRVSSRVSGFPVASPCLWRKLQNISFLDVSKQVVMPFCVAGVSLCDIPQPVLYRAESVKIEGSLARNVRFAAPTCLVSSLWFSCGLAVSMEEAAKHLLFGGFQAGCHAVLRGRRVTLWHSNLFYTVPKVSNLEEVSHEMLVLLLPRVSSRVSGFPAASPCL